MGRIGKADWKKLLSVLERARREDLGNAAFGFTLFFFIGAVVGWLNVAAPSPPLEQPIAFNHRLHIEDVGLECKDCHAHYEEETYSGLPEAESCSFCHEEPQGQTAEEKKLAHILGSGGPIAWNLLFRQPSHVFFSHQMHVEVAGLECEACHGRFAATERPPTKVEKLTMDDCIECHHDHGVRDDCTVCHR